MRYDKAMSARPEIFTLLRSFANKQNSSIIYFTDFCEYMKMYARRYVAEKPHLAVYFEPQDIVMEALEDMEIKRQIALSADEKGKKTIIIPFFFIEKTIERYKEIKLDPSLPFITESELSNTFPQSLLVDIHLPNDLFQLYDKMGKNEADTNESILYRIQFPKETPGLLFPSALLIQTLFELAFAKIQFLLRNDDSKDYFAKKLKISNPGKELTVKNFVNSIITNPASAIESLKESGDSFFYWSQLCMFIRQDFEKVQDKTPKDISIIQAVYILEYSNAYYKNKVQLETQRNTALKNLELALKKPPYYFDIDTIFRFTDSRGVPLLGQYSQEDLQNFLQNAATTSSFDNLPELLTFKPSTEMRYYIYKDKVFPLIVRLCGEVREAIKTSLIAEWKDILQSFSAIPEMKDQKLFEKKLEAAVDKRNPILYELLNSSFLPLIFYDSGSSQENPGERMRIFNNGRLVPYSELLMLDRQELYTDAKITLSFWYTIPIISAILSLLFGKHPPKPKEKRQNPEKKSGNESAAPSTEIPEPSPRYQRASKKDDLKAAAAKAEKAFIPEGSSLEKEIELCIREWNRILDKKKQADLTEDVNVLIRDYTRKVLRTLKGTSFTPERIRNLAETLVDTPSMKKITERDALRSYIQLYMIKLVKNL
ncbi:MAG: hypothetical protein LBR68_07260 [Lachnoclostridium sp.]|nr:hypothetical protein [Lachnoclostridium sp.]